MTSKTIKSLMTPDQKSEIERRSLLYKQGKLKTSTWAEVKKGTKVHLILPH